VHIDDMVLISNDVLELDKCRQHIYSQFHIEAFGRNENFP